MISTLKFLARALGSTQLAKKKLLAQRKQQLHHFLTSNAQVVFPKPKKPRASIVIPVHNHAYHTLHCLLSLQSVAADWLEVLVQDDFSSDETQRLLSRFENIAVYRTDENLGFIGSANRGVRNARGKFVILLNNDANLVEGSLSHALDVFEAEKDCGLMGARIALASGGLQEAGGLIYSNGKTNGYLRHHSIDDPRALAMRDVDYCSGVFLIFRKTTFLELGGFDERYYPAYYEDTDFCMRLRKYGLRCIYNPELLVEHFEFGSTLSFGKRALIKRNRHVFMEKWGEMLRQGLHHSATVSTSNEKAANRLHNR